MNDKLSLTELQLIIKDSLYISLPGMYWVIAEISEIKENYTGHCYLELVEKHPDEINLRARVRAVIWAKRYHFLRPLFESITGESLKEGMKVLLKVTVEYHEIYGLSLVINDIDPAFTVGEMAVKRQQIIRRLEQEGVFSMNKELDFPVLPNRIAVISSKNAAGYSDFLKHLTENNYRFKFHTALFDTSMQGTETEKSVIDALDRISENIELFDVVVIIRGGGSQTDLSWFDNYKIAYHITQFPLPVLTGIGHEKDMTITDMVAWQSLKTPTAVADFVIRAVSETENYLLEMSNSISELSLSVIRRNSDRIDRSRMKLIPVATMKIADEKRKLSAGIMAMINTGKEYLVREEFGPANLKSKLVSIVRYFMSEREKSTIRYHFDLQTGSIKYLKQTTIALESFNSNLVILNPKNVLKRGYTMTSLNGRILKSAGILKEGDTIETRFSDGTVNSKVVEKKE
ncbi:MAG: exodeoxyribonuclease VII large subunit [Odoribacter sp.]|nr:exodeoxyribonuclease VII large subunit [Odoribacter sp.]